MQRSPCPSTSDRRNSESPARRRALPLALLALVAACAFFSGRTFAQQPEGPSEAVAPIASDDEPQELHDAASLERSESSSPEKPSSAPVADPIAEPEAAEPARDLLSEHLAAGDGRESAPLPFEHGGILYVLVTTPPHRSAQHAKNDLDQLMLEAAAARYSAAMHSPRVEFWFPLDPEFVRTQLLVPGGERIVSGEAGQPDYVGHALLKFDEAFERRLRAVRVASRSMQIVVAGGTALALLSVAFAFLRLDRATRGLYTGRLQTWSIVAGAVVICVAGAVAYWIPWI